MGYFLYLIGLAICVIYGIGLNNLCNFIDIISLGFVVIPCILILVSTGYWKGFIKAFLCVINRSKYTTEERKDSVKAVKLVCISSLIFGGLGFTIGFVNSIHSFDLSESYLIPDVGAVISTALISIFYALLINAVLVPLYFELKHLNLKAKG